MGGVQNLIRGLQINLSSNPYFNLPSSTWKDVAKAAVYNGAIPIAIALAIAAFLKVASYRRGHERNAKSSGHMCVEKLDGISNVEYALICEFAWIGYAFFCKRGNEIANTLAFTCLLYWGIRLKALWNDKKIQQLLVCIITPSIIISMVMAFTTYSQIVMRLNQYIVPTMFLIVLDQYMHLGKTKNVKIMIVLVALLSTLLLKSSYEFVYRDAEIKALDTKVSEGIYKGIYTTEERADTLVKMEEYLSEKVNKDEKVLFMETVPFAYLMTEGISWAPSTWDISLYTYGYNDDTLYQEYFKMKGDYPDKIIYINSGRDAIMSIDVPDYKFTQFVNKQYTLISDEIVGTMRVVLYEKNSSLAS